MTTKSSNPSRRPRIGITMGDPNGIGPEIVIKALLDRRVRDAATFVIYGMNEVMTYTADTLEVSPFWYRAQQDSARAALGFSDPTVVLDFDEYDGVSRVTRGPTKAGGLASKHFVEQAIQDAMLPASDPRHLDAIVTAPISKESWRMAGFRWPGHTELLTHRTKSKRSAMMFVAPKLRVVLATIHIPLMQVRDVLNIGKVFEPIDLGHAACREIGIDAPRIAVCGLNPHASENGQFGSEEARIITPAIDMAIAAGIDASGPFPADTIFNAAAAGKYDLVVAMYHDQGLIPVKLLAWDEAVNWTIGLPIVRTSPDHGTAFDIAGRNTANALSMQSAIELGIQLASERVRAASQPTHTTAE